jgi:hypothetical protein
MTHYVIADDDDISALEAGSPPAFRRGPDGGL